MPHTAALYRASGFVHWPDSDPRASDPGSGLLGCCGPHSGATDGYGGLWGIAGRSCRTLYGREHHHGEAFRGFQRGAREPTPHETGQHFDREAVRHQDGLSAPARSGAGKNGKSTPLPGI